LIYVNDNYDDFAATREDIVRQALDGAELVKSILPDQNWAFLERSATAPFMPPQLRYLLTQLDTISRIAFSLRSTTA
jgi:hypothetical protein